MKFVDATAINGRRLRFWLKQGWTDTRNFSAIQFGLFAGPGNESLSDAKFVDYVSARVESAKREGATHALLVHMVDELVTNWVALGLDDVLSAYREQIRGWPNRARSTKSATLWFEDSRGVEGSDCVKVVVLRELDLAVLSGAAKGSNADGAATGTSKVTVEIETRMKQ